MKHNNETHDQKRKFNIRSCLTTYDIHSWNPFYLYWLTLILGRISDYIHYDVWYEITYPFPNFNSAIVKVWEWISNFIPQYTGNMLTYPWWEYNQYMLLQRGPWSLGYFCICWRSKMEYHEIHTFFLLINVFMKLQNPGLFSLIDKTSYRKISWSLLTARLMVKLFHSFRNFTGTSAAPLS